MGEKITAKVETITPEIAKTMLGENVNNRRISRDNVNLFAREIRTTANGGSTVRPSNSAKTGDCWTASIVCSPSSPPTSR